MPVCFYQAIHSTAFFDKVEKGNIFQWITLQCDFCFQGYIPTVMLPQENFRKVLEFDKLEEKTVQLFWLFRKNSKQYEGIYQDWYTFGLLAEWKTHLMDIPSQVTWIRDQWGMKLSNRQIKNQNTPSKLTFFPNTRKQISNSWFFLRRNNSIIDQDRSVKMARYQPWFFFFRLYVPQLSVFNLWNENWWFKRFTIKQRFWQFYSISSVMASCNV